MEMKVALLFFLLLLFSLSSAEVVSVTIRGENSIATTDDNFICATLDSWPNEKCNYNQCPWGNTSILKLDLKNKILMDAIKAFNPMRIRIGGSLQDLVVYDVGNANTDCSQFKPDKDGLFGFSNGCLPHNKRDELNNLFNQTRALLTCGLNAPCGKKPPQEGILWLGPWDPQNTRDLVNYTITNGYKIDSHELDELCGDGIPAKLDSVQYGEDIVVLKNLVKELYPVASTRPKVLGPAGFYKEDWFNTFLRTIGPEVTDGVTHHIYNLGSGADPNRIKKLQDPFYLDHIAQAYVNVSRSVKKYAPSAGAWIGEGGGAYNSGGRNVPDRFVGGFWYLHQLGMASNLNHKLLGKEVLYTGHDGSPFLRAYSHCSRHRPGVTLLLINLSNATFFDISITEDFNLHRKLFESQSQREEYHLTAKDGNIQSDVVLLNESPLQQTNSFDIPQMEPALVDSSSAFSVAPLSFVFVGLKDIKAPACA